jgi:hypothetical protein
MTMPTIRVFKGGGLRTIHNDDYRFDGVVPKRASHVEPIQAGPCAGKWFADMSPLGDAHQLCLWPPFSARREALKAESDYITTHWILGEQHAGT